VVQVADAFVRYLADTKELEKAVGPNGAAAAASNRGARTVADRFSGAFRTAGIAGGVAGGALFTTAIEGATKFEDQLRTVNTVAGLPEATLQALGDDVQALARETGRSTDDLTAGLYDLVSAGVPADQAINVLRDSAKLAVGALGTTGEAVDAVTSALNAYELGADQSTRVTDVLAKAVQDGKVNISEIGATIANIAPIAASAGVSLEEVSAGYAALTAKGVPAAQAATQMRAAISALLTPNEKLLELQEETGVAFADVAAEKGLAVALEELRKATGGNDEAFAKALGSIDAYQFALATTGDNAEDFQGQIVETFDAAGIANDQYAEKSKSALEQGRRLFASFETFAQDIGGPVVGTLGSSVFALNEVGRAFGIPIAPARILGATIGGVFGKVIPSMIGGIGKILPAVIPALTSLVGGMGAVVSAALAAWPLLLLAAVVAAIVFLINNPEIVAQIGEFIGSLLEWVVDFLGDLPGILVDAFVFALTVLLPAIIGLWADIWRNLLGLAGEAIRAIVGFFLSLPGRIVELVPRVFALFVSLGRKINAKIAAVAGEVVAFILSIPGRIAGLVGEVLGLFGRLATSVNTKVQELARSIVAFFMSIPGRIASLGGKIVSGIIRGMSSLPGKLINTVANAFRAIKIDIGPFHISAAGVSIDLPNIQLPSFDVGSSFVPADMLAMVHKGEIIIPAKEAEAIREGRLSVGHGLPAGPLPALAGGPAAAPLTVVFQGALPTRTIADVTTGMRRLQDTGILVSPTAAPQFRTPLRKEE
jgi:TP901 family phage tail tape measure protein